MNLPWKKRYEQCLNTLVTDTIDFLGTEGNESQFDKIKGVQFAPTLFSLGSGGETDTGIV